MTLISYGEAINHFKKTSTPDKVVPLLKDKSLIDALLAWKSVIISYKQSGLSYQEPDSNRLWQLLWENVSFDMDNYGTIAGLKVQDVRYFFERLKGLKLIYPDGTIDLFAGQYINSIIMKELGIKPKPVTEEEKKKT